MFLRVGRTHDFVPNVLLQVRALAFVCLRIYFLAMITAIAALPIAAS